MEINNPKELSIYRDLRRQTHVIFGINISSICYCHSYQVPDMEDVTLETAPYSNCPECESLKKERKKLKRKVRDLNVRIGHLKDTLQKNQEDWVMSFKELENQQPALVTSGVLIITSSWL